jgi:hypothetical protein
MDRQTRLLETLAQGMLHRHGGPPNDFQRKLEGFLKLRPPTFDTTDDDPIAAEDWLREMEKKLDLTTCTDEECVGVAAHRRCTRMVGQLLRRPRGPGEYLLGGVR